MKPQVLILTILIVLLTCGLAVGSVVLFDQVEHLIVFVTAGLLLGMWVIPPTVQYFRGKFDFFEPTVPYGAMNFLYYGAGSLFVLFVPKVAANASIFPYLDLAAIYCTLGYACVLAGYYFSARFIHTKEGGPIAKPGWWVIALLYLAGFMSEFVFAVRERLPLEMRFIISASTSLITQFYFLSTFALMYVVYMLMAGKSTRALKVLLFGLMIPTQALGLFLRFGNKTPLFLAIGIPILAHWYAKRRIAWKTITVVVTVSVLIVFPLYYTVRGYQNQYYTQQYRIDKTFQSMRKQDASVFAQNALITTAQRLALINSTAAIIRDCGHRVEYKMGETLWLGVISSVIPRFLWPTKPNSSIGVEIGRTFHLTGFGSYTSISPSQAGELYWNFNVPGIIIGMFLLGVILRGIYARFGENQGRDPFRLALYVTAMYGFLTNSDGTLGALEANLIRTIVLLLIVEKIVERSAYVRGGAASAMALDSPMVPTR